MRASTPPASPVFVCLSTYWPGDRTEPNVCNGWKTDIDRDGGRRQPSNVVWHRLSYLAALAVVLGSPLAARPNGKPNFSLTCGVGSKSVSITTQDGRLVYSYGTPRRTELEIRESRDTPNTFYRYDLLGVKGGGQQLRFTHGDYSYGISSWFIAGRDGDEGVAFFILRDGKLLKWRECKGSDWFTEDNQLDRLPRDPLWVSSEGVQTGEIPGVTPFP